MDSHLNKILILNKPKGLTSTTCGNVVKKLLSNFTDDAKIKCGHIGTLDPNATGILPLLFNKSLKLADYVTAHPKEYMADFQFGLSSPTYDNQSDEIVETGDKPTSYSEVTKAFEAMVGTHELTVSAYSAKKVNGKRGYELARKYGQKNNMGLFSMTINSISLMNYNISSATGQIKVSCQKGTYIRSIIHDAAIAIKSNAIMTELIRTRQGKMTLAESITLDKFREICESAKTLDEVMGQTMHELTDFLDIPRAYVSKSALDQISHGISPSLDKYAEIEKLEDHGVLTYAILEEGTKNVVALAEKLFDSNVQLVLKKVLI